MPTPRVLSAMGRFEKIALFLFSATFLISFIILVRKFYIDATIEVPKVGGTYIEGSVGEVKPLMPWFTITNDVNRDIVSLVFSGLLKYDPKTKKIVEDLATLDISSDARTYTLKLKPNIFWHDSTADAPHPVTADDVIFTYAAIQSNDFPNPLLRQNFRGVEIQKIDDRTVRFQLKNPYTFFVSNLTLGLVPAKSFEGVSPDNFDQVLDYGYHPIGCGPYEFVSLIQTDFSTEVTLHRFERPDMPKYKFERVVFRVFPDYNTLLADLSNLDGVRQVPRNEKGEPILPRGFKAAPYTLPQYGALFFNLSRPIVQDRALRLGLQLATNKQEIVDALHETQIVDTPLLELDLGDWRYQFDPQAAQGALFESQWNLPEKVRLQSLLEQHDANAQGQLQFPDQVVLLDTGALLLLTGSLKDVPSPAFVNGVKILSGSAIPPNTLSNASGAWMVRLGTGPHASGGLHTGMNIVRMTDAQDMIIDSAYIERLTSNRNFLLSRTEQELVKKFLASKNNTLPSAERLTNRDFFLEDGYLRRRLANDAQHVRVDEKGQPLHITLLTSSSPASYPKVAEIIKKQWENVGVEVQIDIPPTHKEFEERILQRNYDVLLFGESLLDNLDSYPYWHSSQVQDTSGDRSKIKLDAFNLSQYTSLDADILLQRIRETSDALSREKSLVSLNEILSRDVPAIFLYSPLYIYGYREHLNGVQLGTLSLHSDRFLSLSDWYIQTEREFKPGKGWTSFFGWLPTIL